MDAETLRRILGYVRRHWQRALVVAVCSTASAALNLTLPWFIKRIVDVAIPSGNVRLLWWCCAGMVAGPLAAGAIQVAQKYSAEVIGQRVMFDLRIELYRRMLAMPLGLFTKQPPGAAVSHVLNDVQGVGGAVSGTLVDVLHNGVVLLSTAAFLLALDWRLALLATAMLPLFVAPTRRVGRTRKRLKRAQQQHAAELTGIVSETLSTSGALLVKTFGTQDAEVRRFETKAEEMRQLALEQSLVGRWFQMLMGVFESVGPAIVFAAGGVLVIRGHLALGTIVAFVSVLKRLYGPASALAGVHIDLVTSYAYFERVFSALDRLAPAADSADLLEVDRIKGRVEFRRVWFAHDDADATLADINLVIPAGTTVGVVGASGAGKSTLAALLTKVHEPAKGSVWLDGIDIRTIRGRSVAAHLGVVTQDSFLFHATVLENLRYGRPAATQAEVEQAARAAQVHDVVMALPKGYHTVVGDRGYRFSAGERQRLAIARALVRDPAILVLDEATSALDAATERRIQDALNTLRIGRTTLVIAHRLSAVRDADHILVLDRGRIVERGTHTELVSMRGRYAELWAIQSRQADRVPHYAPSTLSAAV